MEVSAKCAWRRLPSIVHEDATKEVSAPLLQSLDTNIARLPSGEMRKMLRLAAGQMRLALGASR